MTRRHEALIATTLALLLVLLSVAEARGPSALETHFRFFDRDGDGRLSSKEVAEGVWALESEDDHKDSPSLPPSDLLDLSKRIIVRELDANLNGFIEWGEYEARFSSLNDHDAPEQIHLSIGNSTSSMTVTWVTKCLHPSSSSPPLLLPSFSRPLCTRRRRQRTNRRVLALRTVLKVSEPHGLLLHLRGGSVWFVSHSPPVTTRD